MALTTDARVEITAALTAAGLPAFPYLPPTVSLPAVIITPRDPYVIPDRIGRDLTYTANFRVSMLAQALDNESGLAACEALIDRTMAAMPDGVLILSVGAPLIDDLGAQGSAYVAEMDVAAHVTGTVPTAPLPHPAGVVLPVDLYDLHYVRMGTDPVLDDLAPHWVHAAIATTPGPNGEVFADTDALRATNAQAVWFDHGGQLGHVKTNSGVDLTANNLARYIEDNRTLEVQLDVTDPAHPVLHILTTRLPQTH